jgi:hypothetical protein
MIVSEAARPKSALRVAGRVIHARRLSRFGLGEDSQVPVLPRYANPPPAASIQPFGTHNRSHCSEGHPPMSCVATLVSGPASSATCSRNSRPAVMSTHSSSRVLACQRAPSPSVARLQVHRMADSVTTLR